MQLVILANGQQEEEILAGGIKNDCKINWVKTPAALSGLTNCDVVFDLLFEDNGYDSSYLKEFLSKLVFVNAVNKTIDEIGQDVIRINGWPGFLKRPVAELACKNNDKKNDAELILELLNREPKWVPDIKGFVSARVISMIINEAYFALDENVSTKEEIDTAMKLGTNYPYGPFEWANRIGLNKIVDLLSELSKSKPRYNPSKLLLQAAGQ